MKKQSTGKGFAYLSIAELLVKIMSVVYVPLLIRILGGVGHGIYVVSYDAFTLIYVLTNEGIQRGIAKLISELHAKDNPRDALRAFRLSRSILIIGGLFASLLLYVMAPYIANAADTADATLSIRALAPTVLITAILSAYRGYFLGRSFMSANALSKVIEQFVNVVVSLTAAYFLMKIDTVYGVAGGTLGTSIGALVAVGLLIHEFRKSRLHKIRRKDQDMETYHYTSKELVQKLFSYAFPITVSAGMIHLGGFIDMFVVNNRLRDAGLVYVAAKTAVSELARFKALIFVPNTIVVALAAVLLPGISAANVVGDDKEVKRKIRYAIKMVFLVTIPSFVGLTLLARPIYDVLRYGGGGVELLRYGSITIIFLGFVQIQNVIFQGLGKFYWGTITLMVGILLRLLINYILVGMPEINIMGAIVSNFVNYFVPFVANHYLITKVLHYEVKLFRNAIGPIIASIFMGITIFFLGKLFAMVEAGWLLSSVLTLVNIGIRGYVYFVGLLYTGGITIDDHNGISPRLYHKVP
ncbi:MAG: polysaccharide biosynthesis protein, partial [Clostridium sp.]|nr:polysaccharide biosynthesis protein [Clostridium sp.]